MNDSPEIEVETSCGSSSNELLVVDNPMQPQTQPTPEKTSPEHIITEVFIEKPAAKLPINHFQQQTPYSLDQIYSYYQSRCVIHGEMPIESIVHQIETVFTTQPNSPCLTTLDLTGVLINSKNIWSLKDLLGEQFGLRQLCLGDCGLEDGIVKEICEALSGSRTLNWISYCGNKKIRSEGVQFISRLVRKTSGLRYLDVSGIPVDEKGATFLGQSVGWISKEVGTGACIVALEILKLEGCRLRASELYALTTGLAQSNVKYLNLRHNKIPFDCTPALSNLLTLCDYTAKSLHHLDLRGNNLRHSLGTLMRALMNNTSLVSLNLRENRLDFGSLEEIAGMLAGNKSLKGLNLGGNDFGAKDGWGKSVAALKRIASIKDGALQELGLSNTNLGCDAVVGIADALMTSSNASLRRLDLSYNPIERRGAVTLLDLVMAGKGLVAVVFYPILNSVGIKVEDPELVEINAQIKEKCHYNRELLIARREKRTAQGELAEEPLSAPSSIDSLTKPHIVNHSKSQYSDLDVEPLDSMEELRSEAILKGEEITTIIYPKQDSMNSIISGGEDAFIEPTPSNARRGSVDQVEKFSLLKFQHEILDAEERVILLEEMMEHVRLCVAGGSIDELAVDGDIVQELYNATKSFKPYLERTIVEGVVEDEETLCAALGLNDRIEESLSIYEYVNNALMKQEELSHATVTRKSSGSNRHMENLKAKRRSATSNSNSPRETVINGAENTSFGSGWFDSLKDSINGVRIGVGKDNSRPSLEGRQKQAASEKNSETLSNGRYPVGAPKSNGVTSGERDLILAAINPDTASVPASLVSAGVPVVNEPYIVDEGEDGVARFGAMQFSTGSMGMPPALLPAESSSLLSSPANTLPRRKDSIDTAVGSSDDFPVIPASQLLYLAKPKGSAAVKTMADTSPLKNTRIQKSFSVSSFDDVLDEAVTTINLEDKKYMDDSFLIELDSQMKEIDDFLSYASTEQNH
ncbi:UNVERIFIED_CONTAM: hypothetical protein HDU68_001986 [Siphonaria sp. JEL0065]|nr:hypothetical protein HDU68_001986 [Siphonaria sp. JEL0065]